MRTLINVVALFVLAWPATASADVSDVNGTWLSGDGDGEWSGGTIYDPNNGKTYSCKLKLTGPDTLKVRGYIGISLIGRSETWKRQPD